MKPYLSLLLFVWAFLGSAWAQDSPTSIPILNPDFQADVFSCAAGSTCYASGITGWLIGPSTSLLKASSTQFPDAPSQGIYVAAIGGSFSTGSILQTLGATVQANTLYILNLSVGARADYPFTGYLAALLAGNATLASRNAATPLGGTFVTDQVAYQSGANPAELGQPLQILVKSIGTGQVDISGVLLTAQPESEIKP
jgi:hypothetical protein